MSEPVPGKHTETDLQNQAPRSALRDLHTVTVEDGEDGMLVAKCPELDVVTQGRNLEDVRHNATEAVGLMREDLGKDGEFSVDIRRKAQCPRL